MKMISAKKSLKGTRKSKTIEPRIFIMKKQKEKELKKAFNFFLNESKNSDFPKKESL